MTKAGKWITPLLFGIGAVIWFGWLGSAAFFSGLGIHPVGWIALAVILVIVAANAVVVIKTAHYAVVKRFDKRTSRLLDEGIHLIIPFIDSYDLVSYKTERIPVDETFFSNDKIEIRVMGSVQWRPARSLLRGVFLERSEADITSGIKDRVKAELGNVVGIKEGKLFIESREGIEILVNLELRVDTPSTRNVSARDRLDHCSAHIAELRAELRRADDDPKIVSDIERLFGIEILNFALADVDFSPKMREAMETERLAAARKSAAEHKFKLAKQYKDDFGVTGRHAVNAAEVDMGLSKRQIFTVEGAEGIINVVLGGSNGPAAPKP